MMLADLWAFIDATQQALDELKEAIRPLPEDDEG